MKKLVFDEKSSLKEKMRKSKKEVDKQLERVYIITRRLKRQGLWKIEMCVSGFKFQISKKID